MASTLDLTPRTALARGVGSNADTPPVYDYTAAGSAFTRATRPDYFGWLDHIRAAAGCTRPIRLAGQLLTVEQGTGRVLEQRHTDGMPDAAIYTACGNRRATVCPSCAQTYQRDAFQLLRAGLVGGKGIPDTVAAHPAVFATLTAPSFGPVHARVVKRHTCSNRRRCDCRAEPCHARRDVGVCEHGKPAACWARHESGDAVLGRPLCLDCYDHGHQVVWNLFSGELWHRTKQAAERHLAKLARRRGIPRVEVVTTSGRIRKVAPVRLSPGKVAELQARGAVHFHAIARLDGVNGQNPDAIVPPPTGFTTDDLVDALQYAAQQIAFDTPGHPDRPDGWPIAWGEQVDIRTISTTGEVTDGMVAGYLAKYATKSTEATGHTSTRLDTDTIGDYADPDGDHTTRLIDACWRIGRPTGTPVPLSGRPREPRPRTGFVDRWECPDCGTHTRYPACPTCVADRQASLDTQPTNSASTNPYARLRRWAHMLGFGGHFLTKGRRYSVTFQLLRDTRVAYRRHEHDHQGDEQPGTMPAVDHLDDTTLIVGTLTFAGVGWHTTGDALLANTAAALARERRTTGREELAHELATTPAGTTPAAA
ncbi:replication initiator [Micromonospora musae]|uniref:replication initiator n=1 Tax=Micromonospora musae TaxID=1894970 RepID=UPI0034367A95